ncbi:hypothetical protein B0T26DRAFT_678799 [Lasiosphaeria miniovina]|uniref:Uncharacterized protein n=1 Tax=Lasiosphaeria miniovina TaxID=1954250 RepID=A0AA40DMP8_9PEZI|nr:uncharacterized protein B0T26DRAFT_678799 [Lasiosphaeria miniovina]KAK0709369.1 hypothetical protein B0T26DRAFT_678799 [Lasiosphaeria miniovina]
MTDPTAILPISPATLPISPATICLIGLAILVVSLALPMPQSHPSRDSAPPQASSISSPVIRQNQNSADHIHGPAPASGADLPAAPLAGSESAGKRRRRRLLPRGVQFVPEVPRRTSSLGQVGPWGSGM